MAQKKEKGNFRKAEAGIGALILFIALVLVAAAAAAVFISTSSNLQGRAVSTASGAQKQVTAKVQFVEIWGENATANNGFIGDLYFKVKLSPGSDSLSLNTSYVAVSVPTSRLTYRWNSTSGCSAVNLSNSTLGGNLFLVTPREGYARPGFLQDGDLLDVCVRLPSNITGDTALTLQFVPTGGSGTSISLNTPSVMTDNKIPLYP